MPLGGFRPIAPLVLPRQRGSDSNHLFILRFQVELATIAAVVAGRRRFFHLPGFVQILGKLVRDRADRTDRQTVPAKLAIKGQVALGHNLVEPALLHELQGVDHQHILADIDAFGARNAAVHVEVEHRTTRIFRDKFLLGIGQIRHPMLKGHILKLAMAVRIAYRAVQRMHGQMFLNRFLPSEKEVLSFRSNHHTCRRLGGT